MEVKFVDAWYERSLTMRMQGKYKDVAPYKDKGFRVQYQNNGNWVLVKPALIKLIIETENNELIRFSVKSHVLDFYCKSRISEKLFEKFLNDAKTGAIKFDFFEPDLLTIKRNS